VAVPTLAQVSRVNILTAIRDHDAQGAAPFCAALGFGVPSDEILVERGKRYDARALLAYAHGKATGKYLGPDEVSFAALQVLTDHGFSVVTRADASRPRVTPVKRARSTAAPKPRASTAKPEPVVRLCPTCFTQLSMMGTCDYCE
jgi:hypothetical protein